MDAVGELPDFGNLLLREGGFPHLPAPTMSQFANKADYEAAIKSQSDAWNEAGTKPDYPCLCETLIDDNCKLFQYFDGTRFGFFGWNKEEALKNKQYKSIFQHVEWREVQP